MASYLADNLGSRITIAVAGKSSLFYDASFQWYLKKSQWLIGKPFQMFRGKICTPLTIHGFSLRDCSIYGEEIKVYNNAVMCFMSYGWIAKNMKSWVRSYLRSRWPFAHRKPKGKFCVRYRETWQGRFNWCTILSTNNKFSLVIQFFSPKVLK